jgi:hypothetical protein
MTSLPPRDSPSPLPLSVISLLFPRSVKECRTMTHTSKAPSPLPLPLTPLSTGGFQPRCQTRPALPATTTSNTSYSNTNHHLLLTIPPLPQRPQPPPALTPPPFTLLYYGSPLALASTAWLFFLGSFTPKNTQHHTQQHYRYTHT